MNKAKTSNHQGIALLTVVFLTALAALTLASFNLSQRGALQNASSSDAASRAWSILTLLEHEAIALLKKDRLESSIDTENEEWSQYQFRLNPLLAEFKQAEFHAQLNDEQAKINLNNLMLNGQLDEVTAATLKQLLLNLQLPVTLLDGIIDWLDTDSETISENGAEDAFYSRLEPPYLTANSAITDISELRLIRGFNDQIYAQLSPYLSALPEHTAINLNTAKSVVMTSLDKSATQTSAFEQDILQQSNTIVSEFINETAVEKNNMQTVVQNSSYFRLQSKITVNNYTLSVDSLITRQSDEDIRIIQRAMSYD